MKANTPKYLLDDARKALNEHRLLSALDSLRGMAHSLKAWNEAEKINSTYDAYKILLDYLSKGADDPERNKMYAGFLRNCYEMCDTMERACELTDETSYYATNFRTMQNLGYAGLSVAEVLRKTTSPRVLFDYIWLSGKFSADDEINVADLLTGDDFNTNEKCVVLSALTLSGMRYFDVAKYRLLLDNSLVADARLRVRAMVGLLFVHFMHGERLAQYPDVYARLQLMADVPSFISELELIQAQLFLSLETKRIEQNLRDEIIPRMMDRMRHLKIDRSLGLDELKDKLSEIDLNPEWEEDGTPSKLAEHMKEFVELQQRGADMYLSSFKMLKQRFPFFNVASNWFWPFTYDHPELPNNLKGNAILNMLINHAELCDSDKYSFCLMTEHMPQADANLLKEQMGSSLSELMKGQPTIPAEATFKNELRSYVQDFYRFCNLFIHREAFTNPFQSNLFIVDHKPFNQLLDDKEFLIRMADFAFKDKSYGVAKTLLQRIPLKERSAEACQKLGYCYEQEQLFAEASKTYALANDLKPRSAWTLRRLAATLRNLGAYDEALQAYNELADIYPENATVALRQAECHIYLKDYDTAFKFLFKADYLSPDSGNAERALAWCSLLTGKYEQAEKYYLKVIGNQPTQADWLNAGHTAWLMKQIPLAIERYRKALPDDKKADFLNNDAELLHKAGLTADDLAIMTDAVLLTNQ